MLQLKVSSVVMMSLTGLHIHQTVVYLHIIFVMDMETVLMDQMKLNAQLLHVLKWDTLVVLKLMMVQNVHIHLGYVMAWQIALLV